MIWAGRRRRSGRSEPSSKRGPTRRMSQAILTPAQHLRLRQLAWQAEGPGAFREPEVVVELRLSPEQRERIRTIEEELFFGRIRSTASPAELDASREPSVKLANDRILATLTDEQAQRWKAMIGDPVKGTLSPFRLPISPIRDSRRPSR